MAEGSLSEAAITHSLGTSFIGQRVIYYPVLASTMEIARLEAQKGASEGTVVVADRQTAGRGRIKRLWLSPEGSIAISIILRPDISCLPYLVMVASLAVVHSIEWATGLEPQIKWPNDVLIGNKKVSGILIENGLRGENVDYSILGIGININLKVSGFPDIAGIATSLSDELGRHVLRLGLVRRLLVEVERLYLAAKQGEPVFEEWRDRLVTLGKRVQLRSGKDTYRGIAQSVKPDGSLILRQPDGRLVEIVAGDILPD